MPPRRDKSDAPASRKRALVSCDRCKLRRARCIRDNAEEPCSDCRTSGVHCESKLPRKQRVYGSVETLSVRYRALESIVKGLFPQDNVQDTSVLFTLAAARNIPMPAADDYTPANIFHENTQISLPAGQARLEYPQQPTQLTAQQTSSPQAIQQQSIRSGSTTSSLTSTSKTSQHNPFSEVQPSSNRAEDLIPTRCGVPHYFGPSSSFRLATTIRALSARCRDLQGTHAPRLTHSDSSYSEPAGRAPIMLRPSSTNPSDEEYTISDKQASQLPKRKRSGPEVERTHQRERFDGDNGSNTIEDLLPSRSLADACVQAYFDHVHIFLPLFHRSIFQLQMEATYSRQSELLGERKDMGWLICLALVFAFGCEQLHEHDPDQAQTLRSKYLDFTKTYFRKLLTTNSIANVQALMLLNLHHHSLGQKSTSWLLIGLGARMVSTQLSWYKRVTKT
jgi:proline utilization trans-activator